MKYKKLLIGFTVITISLTVIGVAFSILAMSSPSFRAFIEILV